MTRSAGDPIGTSRPGDQLDQDRDDVQSDGALARRAQDGDEVAFEQLVRRYARSALVSALAIVGESAEADDVVQDSLVLAWKRMRQCRNPDRFGGWFMTIVRRESLKRLRRSRSRRESGPDGLVSVSAPEGAARRLHLAELRLRLLRAMDGLSPGQREVLLCHDLEGMRHGEIARVLGISEVMSRRHLSDARRRMREVLGNDAQE